MLSVVVACAACAAALTASSAPRVQMLRRRSPVVAACAPLGEGDGEGGTDGERRRRVLNVWGRVRQRVLREKGGDSVPEEDLIQGVKEDIDSAIAQRRRRLNAKLGTSLKRFREEVLSEVELQESEAKERQDRLAARQAAILDSLRGLRSDLLGEIEDGLMGVQRGGQTLERALRDMRSAWEVEVNELIEEARADVDLAVADLEEAITTQQQEWRHAIARFEKQWMEQAPQSLGFNATAMRRRGYADVSSSSSSSEGGEGGEGAGEGVGLPRLLTRSEVDARKNELQDRIAAVSLEMEADLRLFKERWQLTTSRLNSLPDVAPRLKTLADVRAYVADTLLLEDDGDLAPPRSTDGRNGVDAAADPLGLRQAAAEPSDPVLRPTAASNLRLPSRQIAIITTAALPWMTGTSINPLLRAAYLAKAGYNVTLYVPWLPIEQQATLFPEGLTFEQPYQQEQYLRWWCENKAVVRSPELRIRWYPGRYSPYLGSIIQDIEDLTSVVPEAERDVVVLEEPEHLNWYHHGTRWNEAFKHVVGIAHTNYLYYARANTEGMVASGIIKEQFTRVMNDVVCQAYTDVVVKLSSTLPDVQSNNLVCNVHGVRAEFLAIGAAVPGRPDGAYYLGKAMYTKGYRELIDGLILHRGASGGAGGASGGTSAGLASGGEQSTDPDGLGGLHIHTFGSGADFQKISTEVDTQQLPITVHPGIDHAHPAMHGYRVFVNPSTSDVLCTATAEALAMGKSVVIPDHPSNTFFKQFSNTFMYDDPSELVPTLRKALENEPKPMADREAYMLSWEAASERLLDAAALPDGTRRSVGTPAAKLAYAVHYAMGVQPVFDVFRTVTGAGPVVPWRERWERGFGHGSRGERLESRSEADRLLQQRESDGGGRP